MKTFTGKNLDHIAFPIGGIGAGMFTLQGTGSIGNDGYMLVGLKDGQPFIEMINGGAIAVDNWVVG
jgi:hypothetical protein